MKKGVSLVIPIYNEEKNIPLLYLDVKPVMESLGLEYELIMVDDGSKDASWQELLKISASDKKVKLLRHGRNMGLTQGYQDGFDHCSFEYVLIMASDLENDAKEILRVIQKLEEGYDVVNTNRVSRWQNKKSTSILRTFPSKVANALIANITGVKLKDNGSGLKGFKRFVVDNLKMYGEMHRYFVSYCSVFTKKITEIDVIYKERIYGKSDYGSITRTFKVFLDLFSLKFLVSLSTKPYHLMPGRLFGSVGIGMSFLGSVLTFYLLIDKFFFGNPIGSRPLLIFSFLFVVLGVQLIMTGFLGELLMRIYFESGGRKIYTVSDRINFD
ncbi:MAG: glycosyltransferase family 2 protein [Patescibacteria group bacterium]